MTALPWMKFEVMAWLSEPGLKLCSLAARGLWIDLLGNMHFAVPYGHLVISGVPVADRDIAGLVGRPHSEVSKALAELEMRRVISRTPEGVIYSRRMVRDKAKADADSTSGKRGGNPNVKGGSVPKESRSGKFSRKDNPSKVEAVWACSGGKCKACGCDMQRDNANQPNAFTIDHIIPEADGGSHDFANLQGLCRSCNVRRGLTPSDEFLSDGGLSRTKTQKEDKEKEENPPHPPTADSRE